jgi:UTRA domain
MTRTVNGQDYINTQEVLSELGVSKKLFYGKIKRRLKAYYFDGRSTPWYLKQDALALKEGRLPRMASIGISGIQRDWTTFLRSLGFRAETVNCTIELATLPEELARTFALDAEQPFIKRRRMTFANGAPICVWATYYPLALVGPDMFEKLKRQPGLDIVAYIKEQAGVVIGYGKDKYTARAATQYEQEVLQLVSNDPVLILQRASYTRDKQTLVLVSDMTLLGNWFAPEHEYQVEIW